MPLVFYEGLMAYSYREFNGDGLTKTFNIPFVYASAEEIAVYVDGVATTAYTFTSSNTLQLATAPANGSVVRIQRTTDLEERAVDFINGSVLSEEDLDKAFIQVFNAAQEAVDKTSETIGKGVDGKFDAQSRVIKNVADPVADTDAVNKQFMVAQTAASVAAAAASAATAAAQATEATNQKNLAAAQANEATSQKNQAAAKAVESAASATAAADALADTLDALNAAKIPTGLTGHAKEFLQVKADASGYELVQSVAAPRFFGFKMSSDGVSIEMTYGRDEDYNVSAFETWTMAENITFEIRNNNLVLVL